MSQPFATSSPTLGHGLLPSSTEYLARLAAKDQRNLYRLSCSHHHHKRNFLALQVCALKSLEQRARQEEHWARRPADEALSKVVQWYPGHIAKAERRLKEQLGMVDVVLEVRDARIPEASCHKQIPQWCGTKPRILVLNRVDMVSSADRAAWSTAFSRQRQPAYWTDGNSGTGVQQLAKAAAQASAEINAKRKARGLNPRPVRACVIGFPNVGKSALINRLLKRRACDSAPRPGVTRSLKWVRVGGELDMLDAPGVIPMSFNDQRAAQLLAICNDIGEASYLESRVAATFLGALQDLPSRESIIARLAERYGIAFGPDLSGEDYVYMLAERHHKSELERAGQRILNDYRAGALGSVALELPV